MQMDRIRTYCLGFPETRENLQWGDVLCFKVSHKIFVTLGLDRVPETICLKCSPPDFAELIERQGVSPAPYLGRFGWVQLEGFDLLRPSELENLIERSYRLVAAKTKTAGRRGEKSSPGKKNKPLQ